MSKPYVPVTRKDAVIGCNIRRGFTPGGYTHQFGASRNSQGMTRKKKDIYSDSREIREAATRVLEQRGIVNQPNHLRDGHGGFGRFR